MTRRKPKVNLALSAWEAFIRRYLVRAPRGGRA